MSAYSSRPIAVLTLSLFAGGSFGASPLENDIQQLDPIVISASRMDKPLSETVSSITVVDERSLLERAPVTFAESLQDLPNVQVENAGSSIFSRISIRGSDANQITYLIDGLRQDNLAKSGNHPTGIFIAPELIKQVEVRNGGGSALYGNGGIGGTIALATKSASDFLGSGETFGTTVKSMWSSGEMAWTKSAFMYGRTDQLDLLLGISRADSGDAKHSDGRGRGKSRADVGHTSVFAKADAKLTDATKATVAYNFDDFGSFWLVDADPQNYAYKQHRLTGSLEHADGGFWDLKGRVQWTSASFGMDQRLSRMGGNQGFDDDFRSWSGSLQNTNRFELAGAHVLTYGADGALTEQTSTTYNPWSPQPRPDGARPDSHGIDAGFFLQDEYAATDMVSFIPVLRWSYFRRSADLGDYDGLSGSRFTPGLTVALTPTEGASFWASAAAGYRPPILDEVFYSQEAIPGITDAVLHANPDLRPERSLNYEIGAAGSFANLLSEADRMTLRAAIFWDDVKDFINVRSWVDETTFATHYRPENIGRVVRKGAEASGSYAAGPWSFSASYGLVHAENRETGRRVSGIAPQSLNARIERTIAPLSLDLWYRFRWEDALSDDPDCRSFATHAVGAAWTPKIPDFWDLSAGVALENLTNEKYVHSNGILGYARSVRFWVSGRF